MFMMVDKTGNGSRCLMRPTTKVTQKWYRVTFINHKSILFSATYTSSSYASPVVKTIEERRLANECQGFWAYPGTVRQPSAVRGKTNCPDTFHHDVGDLDLSATLRLPRQIRPCSACRADCAVILTPHRAFDYARIVALTPAMVDTRNARSAGEKVMV
jgi:hypothetical protein